MLMRPLGSCSGLILRPGLRRHWRSRRAELLQELEPQRTPALAVIFLKRERRGKPGRPIHFGEGFLLARARRPFDLEAVALHRRCIEGHARPCPGLDHLAAGDRHRIEGDEVAIDRLARPPHGTRAARPAADIRSGSISPLGIDQAPVVLVLSRTARRDGRGNSRSCRASGRRGCRRCASSPWVSKAKLDGMPDLEAAQQFRAQRGFTIAIAAAAMPAVTHRGQRAVRGIVAHRHLGRHALRLATAPARSRRRSRARVEPQRRLEDLAHSRQRHRSDRHDLHRHRGALGDFPAAEFAQLVLARTGAGTKLHERHRQLAGIDVGQADRRRGLDRVDGRLQAPPRSRSDRCCGRRGCDQILLERPVSQT